MGFLFSVPSEERKKGLLSIGGRWKGRKFNYPFRPNPRSHRASRNHRIDTLFLKLRHVYRLSDWGRDLCDGYGLDGPTLRREYSEDPDRVKSILVNVEEGTGPKDRKNLGTGGEMSLLPPCSIQIQKIYLLRIGGSPAWVIDLETIDPSQLFEVRELF